MKKNENGTVEKDEQPKPISIGSPGRCRLETSYSYLVMAKPIEQDDGIYSALTGKFVPLILAYDMNFPS